MLRIPGSRILGSGDEIRVGLSAFGSVRATKYLCCACGFFEEWVDDVTDLTKLEKTYKKGLVPEWDQ